MEGEYFEPEDPPSCKGTCGVLCIAAFYMATMLLLPIFFADESTFFLYTMIAAALSMIVLFPASWWAAKRMKKWARMNVERREQDSQYKD